MEIVIIILLAILIVLFLWYILHGHRRLKEQGDALSKAVGERIDGTLTVFGELRDKLGQLAEKTRIIEETGKNISSLREILRAPKPRGGLGELLLERLLADSLPKDYYELQHRFHGGEIVDAVVRIGGKLVPIDAKFPLEDFERMAAAESDQERENLSRQFTRTAKKHIDNVSRYILPDENTFDFALLYVPAENIYYETICQSEIYSACTQNKVFMVSPNSFNAYLQAIVLGLEGLHIESATSEIQGNLRRLQSELRDFQEDYATLGMHITHAARKYDEAERKLARFGDKLQITGEMAVKELPEPSNEIHGEDK